MNIMARILAKSSDSSHRLLPEARPVMAKADLRKADTADWREQIGAAIQRVKDARVWSLKEFADALGRDERQVKRWIDGRERPQFDVLFAVAALRQPLVVAFAELAGAGVEVETVVRVIRKVEAR